jgi:serine/threonine protein kinase
MPSIPRIGAEVAGYRLESVISRGGMAVVYLADHIRLGRKVALKILAEELSEDDLFRERFLRESRTAAGINHGNIIPIYDAGEEGGLLYIAMRYVEGLDLKHLIAQEGSLDIERTGSIIGQVASALDAAHAHGLVHRDVKPGNILVVPRADRDLLDQIYLTDFGLTKHKDSKSGLTSTGQFVGTIDYVAPEQIEGKDTDARTDIYSLGCVLYECLTGMPPYTRDNEVAVIWAHLREAPPKVTDYRPEVPPVFDEVVAKAMAKSPEDRYSTCREMVVAARRQVGRSFISQEPSTPIPSATVAAEPPASGPAEATGPAGPPIVSEAGPDSEAQPALDSRRTQGPQARRRRGWRWILIPVLAFAAGFGAATGIFLPQGGSTIGVYDAIVLPHIPAGIRPNCREVPQEMQEHAKAECKTSGFVLTYADMHSLDALDGKFKEAIRGKPVEPGGGTTCTLQNTPAWDYWAPDPSNPFGHEEIGSPKGDLPAGELFRVACFEINNLGMVIWTDPRTNFYSTAKGPSITQLMAWWQTNAGPQENPGPEAMSG